jgi:methyl-accepting chemotaxis protein
MDILKEINNKKADAQIQALNESYGIISFKPDGTITYINDNFLDMFGYEKNEILNKHHKILCHKSFYESEDYINFWNNLKKGQSQSTVFRRIKKNGESIFLRASYKPLIDNTGNIFEILKFAQNVTEKKLQEINISSQLEAINKSTAIIEFDIHGNILTANNNFLNISGYSLDEIQNKHHSIFCEEAYVKSKEYKLFWDKLRNGVFDSGEYFRLGKNNKKIWIKASYNPIYNIDNEVIKIVKFAQDVTEEKLTSILYTYSLENKNDELQKII